MLVVATTTSYSVQREPRRDSADNHVHASIFIYSQGSPHTPVSCTSFAGEGQRWLLCAKDVRNVDDITGYTTPAGHNCIRRVR